jgi:hypothetical protein
MSAYNIPNPVLTGVTAGALSLGLDVGDGVTTSSCTLNQTLTAPAAGNGGYLGYSISASLSSVATADKFRISIVTPNGKHVIGSPYICAAAPCKGYVDDTGLGQHLYRVEWLNSSNVTVKDSGYKVLHTTQTAVTGVPAPPRVATTPPLEAAAYTWSGPLADKFVATRFDYRVDGLQGNPIPNTDHLQYNPNIKWMKYKDSQTFSYEAEYWKVRDHAAAHGWPYEKYMLHCSIDHTNSNLWSRVHKFGVDETSTAGASTKGLMIWNGSTWVDETEDGWSTGTGDVPLGNNQVYWGYPEPYDQINVIIGTARSAGSVTWEYYRDSGWTPLTVTDASTGFSATAGSTVYTISFTPPSDWAPVAVNGSRSKFFVRATIAGASTTPVLSRTYGDLWLTGGLERGFDTTHAGVVNVAMSAANPDGFPYNPTPPAGSTAKFLYQSRIRSYWASTGDWFMISHFNEAVDGTVYYGKFLSDSMISRLTTDPKLNGVWFDNGDTFIQTIPWPDTYPYIDWPIETLPWVDTNYTPMRDQYAKMFTQIRNAIKAVFPNAIVGANQSFRSGNVSFSMDLAHLENRMKPCVTYAYA